MGDVCPLSISRGSTYEHNRTKISQTLGELFVQTRQHRLSIYRSMLVNITYIVFAQNIPGMAIENSERKGEATGFQGGGNKGEEEGQEAK